MAGQAPSPRSGSGIARYKDLLYLWGGNTADNALYMLHFTTDKWGIVETRGNAPSPMYNFPNFIYQGYFYILPGFLVGTIIDQACFRINLENHVWENVNCDLDMIGFGFTLYDSEIILLGGLSFMSTLTNRMQFAEIGASMMFLEISPHWDYPKPRLKHSLQASREYLWLFGGYSQGV